MGLVMDNKIIKSFDKYRNKLKKKDRLSKKAFSQNFKIPLISMLAYIVVFISKNVLIYNFQYVSALISHFKL